MDNIEHINIKKDTTFALLLEAQTRQWQIFYLQPNQLFLSDNQVFGLATPIQVINNPQQFFAYLAPPQKMVLHDFDVVLMRKDPPFDMPYLYSTYLLDIATKQGVLIINDPKSIRDANEKLFTAYFPQCTPPTLVSSQKSLLRDFLKEHQKIILKPLDTMGGRSVFLMTEQDPNFNVTVEELTHNEKIPIMAQLYLSDIMRGDKRILMIDGKAFPYGLARIPQDGEIRGNLAAGGKGVGHQLTDKDFWISEQVGPTLSQYHLFFVGLDIIGDYLTEINVTSPTCVREIESAFSVNLSGFIVDELEKKIIQSKINA